MDSLSCDGRSGGDWFKYGLSPTVGQLVGPTNSDVILSTDREYDVRSIICVKGWMALVEWEDSWEEVGTPITSPVKVILEAKATKVKIRWAPTWEPLENLRETAALAAFEWRHGPVTVCSGPNKNAAITDEVIVRLRKENEWLTGETERLKEGMERLKKGTERLKQEIQELKGENRWHKWENGELTKEILSLSRLVRQTNLHQ